MSRGKHRSQGSNQRRTTFVLVALLALAFALALVPGGASAAPPPTGSADLDQCANGSLSAPTVPACNPNEWVNGNLGASKAHYLEGDSIPYRMKFGSLATGAFLHSVTIEWDTTKSSKHALDYLTSFDRTVTTANPCVGVAGCSLAVFDTEAIPKDPQVDNGAGSPITQLPGVFTLFGGTITSISGPPAYTYHDGAGFVGDKSARIQINFTTTVANPVLAWGGHIATRQNWGATNSAVAIPGSPYHMRLIDLDGGGGNQDRSLSTEAVIFPASVTIIKDAVPDDAQDFVFATTGGLTPTPFSLDDDSNATLSNTQVFSNILITTNTGNDYTVTETPVSHWDLTFPAATCVVTTPNGGSTSHSTTAWTINLREGEDVTCTFVNTHTVSSPTIATTLSSGTGVIGDFVHDSSSITGATEDAGGTVTYTVYTDNACTLGARDAGTKDVTNHIVPDSDALQFNSAGTFYWQAVYSGDPNNSGATSTCTSEQLVIAPNSPTLSTTPSEDTGVITDVLTDTATLSGTTVGAGTTIDFYLFAPGDDCNLTGTGAVYSSTGVPVNGDDTYSSTDGTESGDNTATEAGIYHWVAIYTGDANNEDAHSGCDEEPVDISPNSPTLSTTPDPTSGAIGDELNDSADLDGETAGATGNITFYLFAPGDDCSDLTSAVYTEVVASSGGSASTTGGGSGDNTATEAGTYHWKAVYEGDDNNAGDSSDCADEPVIIENNVESQITPTSTTCADFNSGAETLDTVNYSVRNGKITQVDPGVFFYWIKVDAAAGSNTFTINQDTPTSAFNVFFRMASGSAVFTSNCVKVNGAHITDDANGDVTIQFNASSAGTYIIGIKYSTGAVKGANAPSPTTVRYTFETSDSGGVIPGSLQGLDLKKKA